MNEIEKPKKCAEHDCNNKAYAINRLSPTHYCWNCRKHYYMYAYGYSEYEASKK